MNKFLSAIPLAAALMFGSGYALAQETCGGEIECVCGDGVVDAGEQCDDGNLINGDGCSETCEVEQPPSTEGCTPGYWKQPQHFDSWVTYSPSTLFSSVFDDAFPGLTLLSTAPVSMLSLASII